MKYNIAITADPSIPVPPLYYGGVERIIDMLIKGLTERGHQITLYAHPDSRVNCRLEAYSAKGQSAIDIFRNTAKVTSLLKGNYDLVHSFGRLAYLLGVLPAQLPKIMSYQREPTISQVKKAIRLSRKNTLYFTGCSNYIAHQIRPYAPSFAIPNGVPMGKYTCIAKVREEAPLVFLGRIEYIKGAHIAIEIAIKTGRKLIIAGNVPADLSAQEYFKTSIKPFIDNRQIEYVGPVNDVQKNEILGNAYAFLMPILWNEPFGIVMIEALACGTPVIGFNRGAVPEVIQNGVNGFVCDTMEEMIAQVDNIRLLDRLSSRKSAEDNFSDRVIINAYERLYQSCLHTC